MDNVGAFSHGHFEWEGILRVLIYPNGIFLKVSPRLYAWLPDRLLIESTVTDARRLAQEQVDNCEIRQ